ncbi:HU family DNA-binding protein [Coraliomargarita sp. SDUM461003]|uniref:HU family DNA-binding protein n=1 Tax=Thalassobacterium maritimum TaxID=3041265 RepID=A0ABU1ARA4_9BACT|nr:HU family DNA-binding protein [Coraliomargarita sp. SDUM461003]MDQ8206693.1 HU family DNA-binding protein [Coraliomargarita sp. SDUM461003]|tara:strand:+ start:259 stop:648 length:390 start_codon:yes stop_codon:yes gene_type:complete
MLILSSAVTAAVVTLNPKQNKYMSKIELVEALQKELGLESKAEATRTLDAVGAVYLKALKKAAKAVKKPKRGEASVKPAVVAPLPGVGNFYLGASAPRKGRNPLDGSSVNVKAKKKISFKASPSIAAKL